MEPENETTPAAAGPPEATPGPRSRNVLRARLDAVPRVTLANLPASLEHCRRLSAAIGGPEIYVKRDDLTGLAFGGNKIWQLEFQFADIQAEGADTVVAGAYTQSNWCRQITAAANKLGLETALILLHGKKGPRLQGNLLHDHVMGADVTITEIADLQDLAPLLEARAAALAAEGRRPYLVSPFGLDTLARSALGYVNAALELDGGIDLRPGLHQQGPGRAHRPYRHREDRDRRARGIRPHRRQSSGLRLRRVSRMTESKNRLVRL